MVDQRSIIVIYWNRNRNTSKYSKIKKQNKEEINEAKLSNTLAKLTCIVKPRISHTKAVFKYVNLK